MAKQNNKDPYNFEKIEAPQDEHPEENQQPIMGKSYQKSKKKNKKS